MSLDNKILERLTFICSNSSNPDLQQSLYDELQSIRTNNNDFIYYLLHILSDQTLDINTRSVSCFLIKGNLRFVDENILLNFLPLLFEYLSQEIVRNKNFLITQENALYVTLFQNYGLSYYSNVEVTLENLLSFENTSLTGLQCISSLIPKHYKPTETILKYFPGFLSGKFCKENECNEILSILIELLTACKADYMDFFINYIFNVIFESMEIYDTCRLNKVYVLFFYTYENKPDENLGNLLAEIILTIQDETSDILECISREGSVLHFNENIIISLLKRTEFPDKFSDFGICSSCLYILSRYVDIYKEKAFRVIMDFINTFVSTSGHLLRCFSLIVEFAPDMHNYILNLAVQSLETIERGDAIICIQEICSYYPEKIQNTFPLLLSLICDEDADVRDKVYFSLECFIEKATDLDNIWLMQLIESRSTARKFDESHKVYELLTIFIQKISKISEDVFVRLFQELTQNIDDLDELSFKYFSFLMTELLSKSTIKIPTDYSCLINCCVNLIENHSTSLGTDLLLSPMAMLFVKYFYHYGAEFYNTRQFVLFIEVFMKKTIEYSNKVNDDIINFIVTVFENGPKEVYLIALHWKEVLPLVLERVNNDALNSFMQLALENVSDLDELSTCCLAFSITDLLKKNKSNFHSNDRLVSLVNLLLNRLGYLGRYSESEELQLVLQ